MPTSMVTRNPDADENVFDYRQASFGFFALVGPADYCATNKCTKSESW